MTGRGSTPAPHVPVLLDEVIGAMAIQPGETAVDGTFGAGGYTLAMLQVGAGRVIAFDRDPEAIEAGRSLVPDPNLTLVEDRFSQMDRVLADRGVGLVDAITLDIGVSSMQLDRADRGFSFSADGPLDMRMEKSGATAADFLNEADEAEIVRVLRDYGEEPRARTIARAIVANRPIERTGELAAIVRRAVGYRTGQKSDPATRTFQAIRIHLNAELDELEGGLAAAEGLRDVAGRHEEHAEQQQGDQPDDEQAAQSAPDEEPDHFASSVPVLVSAANSRSVRGSNASRTPSPKVLKASVVISSARPGNRRYHQATR